MSSISDHFLPFIAGTGIGVFYFGGLLWTVCRLVAAAHPASLTLISFLVRTGVSLGAFYLIMGGHWERLMVALLGVMAVRFVMVRKVRCGIGNSCATDDLDDLDVGQHEVNQAADP